MERGESRGPEERRVQRKRGEPVERQARGDPESLRSVGSLGSKENLGSEGSLRSEGSVEAWGAGGAWKPIGRLESEGRQKRLESKGAG